MITLTTRVPAFAAVAPGHVNASVGEIQAALNKMGVLRGTISEPQTDYFRFDNDAGKLYLVTIEGNQHEVGLT